MRRRIWTFTCTVAALSVSCGDPVEPDLPLSRGVSALFQTDSLAYTMRRVATGYDVQIGVAFVNRTSTTVYIPNCGGASSMRVDKLVGNVWQPAWAPVILACLSAPIVIGVGDTYTTRLVVYVGDPGTSLHPQFDFPEIAGEYRIVWLSLQDDPDPRSDVLVPFEFRVSNRFRLSTADR